MVLNKIFFCLAVVFSTCFASSFAQDIAVQKIVFIRHGEKPDEGDNLSCKGFNRALKLPAVLDKKFGAFNAVFVPALKEGKNTTQARMYQTITPYAVKHNITLNTKYEEKDIAGIVKGITKSTGTILLVWEHKNILAIVNALGIKNAAKWDNSDFDSIWIVTYTKGQPKLTVDKENINPAATCE